MSKIDLDSLPPAPKPLRTDIVLYKRMPELIDRMRTDISTDETGKTVHIHFGPAFSGFSLCLNIEEAQELGASIIRAAERASTNQQLCAARQKALEAQFLA